MGTKGSSARSANDASSSSLTLRVLWALANEWCPRDASWTHLLDYWDSWGPSHEIGHALIEPYERQGQGDYGRCTTGFCRCDDECDVYEIAAMLVSKALVTAAGHPELADKEIEDTTDYDLAASPQNYRRARALLRKKKLWPVPKTREALEAALKRNLRRRVPVSKRRQRAKRTPPKPWLTQLAEAIMGPGTAFR